jgi:FeS assembly protein IscX
MKVLDDSLTGVLHHFSCKKYSRKQEIKQINIFFIPVVDVLQDMYNNSHMSKRYHWDATYEIALALKAQHPNVNLETVSLQMIFEWVIALPEFEDDLELVNDEILTAIFQEWYEEIDE